MSKIFYDDLIVLAEVEKEINTLSQSKEEKDELWELVDGMVHQKVMSCLFDNLPERFHEEFIEKFDICPYDEGLLDYLKEKINKNVEDIIKAEVGSLAFEILQDLRGQKAKKKK